jgi:putative nucleotidyltransferase with HDIG domain
MVPSVKWVHDLIRLSAMPEHVIRHSLMVSRVSVMIASKMPDSIDMIRIHRAAMLHDISKMDSIRTGSNHAMMGGRLLDQLGCPEIAWIIRQHVRLESMELNEAMVVNYADKRVMHDQVVSLSRRFVDLMERYGRDEMKRQRIYEMYSKALETEKTIIGASGIEPERLNDLNLMRGHYFFNSINGIL